ncbi:MAG: cbb3-type cytochrome c oxidase subunit 3 [Alphaproteobacteria bacterium]|nr:cbb3-type cytochrome c oxidase subunit 3 [Alphaproteobacteria bacterium]
MSYADLAAFARTFGLVYLVAMLAVALFYALRPRNRGKFRDAAMIPLRKD